MQYINIVQLFVGNIMIPVGTPTSCMRSENSLFYALRNLCTEKVRTYTRIFVFVFIMHVYMYVDTMGHGHDMLKRIYIIHTRAHPLIMVSQFWAILTNFL